MPDSQIKKLKMEIDVAETAALSVIDKVTIQRLTEEEYWHEQLRDQTKELFRSIRLCFAEVEDKAT